MRQFEGSGGEIMVACISIEKKSTNMKDILKMALMT